MRHPKSVCEVGPVPVSETGYWAGRVLTASDSDQAERYVEVLAERGIRATIGIWEGGAGAGAAEVPVLVGDGEFERACEVLAFMNAVDDEDEEWDDEDFFDDDDDDEDEDEDDDLYPDDDEDLDDEDDDFEELDDEGLEV